MAEEILVLMAVWDDETQKELSEIYAELTKEGFKGKQTPDVPYHISMSTYTLDKEAEAVELMKKIASEHAPVEVDISHLGLFAGGNILFAAPDKNAELDKLHDACDLGVAQAFSWTPHTTILIDDAEVVQDALPTVIKTFKSRIGTITKLQLCAFWPTREILTVELKGEERS